MASENFTIMPNIVAMIVVFSWVENSAVFQNFGEICWKLKWKIKMYWHLITHQFAIKASDISLKQAFAGFLSVSFIYVYIMYMYIYVCMCNVCTQSHFMFYFLVAIDF